MPARVIDEHEKFITVEILPHINPKHVATYSKPYAVDINKTKVFLGEVEIYVDGLQFRQ